MANITLKIHDVFPTVADVEVTLPDGVVQRLTLDCDRSLKKGGNYHEALLAALKSRFDADYGLKSVADSDVVFVGADLNSTRAVRSGDIDVTMLETSKTVTFSSPLPSDRYAVVFSPQANLTTILWASDKTKDDFTLNLSVGVDGTISYIAAEN